MSDFRYLDYEGLATYTEQVKGYADGKIVYLSDESEIPDPPKEGTLYVIGSEILMDEEIIIGTQTSNTSAWTGKSIDTRLHNGKRIAYYLPYPSVAGVVSSLTLELSDEDNTITPAIRIMAEGGSFNRVIPGGSVIRMTYFENIMMNGATRSGWICDGNIIQNNVTYTGTLVDEQVATFEGSTGTIKSSGYTIAKSVPSSAVFTDTKNTAGSTDSASKLYLIGATSQAANPQTYSHNTAYVDTDGCLYSNSEKVVTVSDIATSETDGIMSFIDKIKLNGISPGAEANVQSDWSVTDTSSDAYIMNKPSNATSSVDGFMSSEDKTKLDKIQDFYEVIVDLSSYTSGGTENSYLDSTTFDGISSFKIGDKIRIKSNTTIFPPDYTPSSQYSIWSIGYNVQSCQNNNGSLSCIPLGILRWPTTDDTDIVNSLHLKYNIEYAYPNQQLLKYGGYIDVMIIAITNAQYICIPLFNNSCGYISRNAINATNATNAINATNATNAINATNATNTSKVNISRSSSSNSYPLVFTDSTTAGSSITAGNKSLFTDTYNSLHYNPSLNTLTVPTANITTANITTLTVPTANITTANITTAQFSNSVKLPAWSNTKHTFNVKGADHDTDSIVLYGGSLSNVATLTVKGIGGDTTALGNISCGQLIYTGGSLGTSDERLKNFENDIEIDFNKLKKIPKKYFTWKYDEDKVINIGTSAQEVEKIYPEIIGEYVDESTDIKYKSLDYSKLSIIALAAIDKLNERIEYLENKLKEYEK